MDDIVKTLVYWRDRAEAAQAAHYLRSCGALGHAFDAFDQRFACIDIDASVLVAEGGLLAHRIRTCERSAGVDRQVLHPRQG